MRRGGRSVEGGREGRSEECEEGRKECGGMEEGEKCEQEREERGGMEDGEGGREGRSEECEEGRDECGSMGGGEGQEGRGWNAEQHNQLSKESKTMFIIQTVREENIVTSSTYNSPKASQKMRVNTIGQNNLDC